MLEENIRRYRMEKGLSQEELADAVNVVRQTVSKWERGLSVPDADQLQAIARVLGITVNALLGEETEVSREAGELTEKLKELEESIRAQKRRAEKRWKWVSGCVCILGVLSLVYGAAYSWILTHLTDVHYSAMESTSIGVIGGADGPTAIFVTSPYSGKRILLGLLLVGASIILCLWRKHHFREK